jgi:hypothetical protein
VKHGSWFDGCRQYSGVVCDYQSICEEVVRLLRFVQVNVEGVKKILKVRMDIIYI